MSDTPKSPSPDDLTKTTGENKIELTEAELGDDELNKVSGGTSGTSLTRQEVATFIVRAFYN